MGIKCGVSHKVTTQTDGVWAQGAEENVWIQENGIDRKTKNYVTRSFTI
jgi:hypothetical protein